MKDNKILRCLSKIFSVNEAELPATIKRFKKETEEMKKELDSIKKS